MLAWIEEVKREMLSHERPRDVSGVELLMNNHQSLKAEIDTREENFRVCIALGFSNFRFFNFFVILRSKIIGP